VAALSEPAESDFFELDSEDESVEPESLEEESPSFPGDALVFAL
jgi:hypothetical protein